MTRRQQRDRAIDQAYEDGGEERCAYCGQGFVPAAINYQWGRPYGGDANVVLCSSECALMLLADGPPDAPVEQWTELCWTCGWPEDLCHCYAGIARNKKET